jgi:hypothetical protein
MGVGPTAGFVAQCGYGPRYTQRIPTLPVHSTSDHPDCQAADLFWVQVRIGGEPVA